MRSARPSGPACRFLTLATANRTKCDKRPSPLCGDSYHSKGYRNRTEDNCQASRFTKSSRVFCGSSRSWLSRKLNTHSTVVLFRSQVIYPAGLTLCFRTAWISRSAKGFKRKRTGIRELIPALFW